MKQTNVKSKQRNINKPLEQHRTINAKTNQGDLPKSPLPNRKGKDFLIHKAIHFNQLQRQLKRTAKGPNDSMQKENFQFDNFFPKKRNQNAKPSVNKNPLESDKASKLKPRCKRGYADSSNVSLYLNTDESQSQPAQKQQQSTEDKSEEKETKPKNRSRAISSRLITSSSLVKKKSSNVLPCFQSDNKQGGNDNSEIFDYATERKIELNPNERDEYGDRHLANYIKGALLGKGGCGIVWNCVNSFNGNEFALKQISKRPKRLDGVLIPTHNAQMAKKEIEVLSFIKKQLESTNDASMNHMISLIDHHEDANDVWLVFEKGGKSLSSLSFRIKGEFCGSERVYSIKQGKFLHKLIDDMSQLKLFISKMLSFIHFLSINNVVHGDIKPDNILIEYNEDFSLKSLKVIDFGSAYFLTNPSNFSSNTPEYMSPEITKLLESNKTLKEVVLFLNTLRDCPWCVDMWSLGVSLLETVLACPLWMSYKAKVSIRGKAILKTGLFGFKGRDGNKIYSKQIEVSKNLKTILKQSLINDSDDLNQFYDLISKMLEIDYTKRISPVEALNHPFLLKKAN